MTPQWWSQWQTVVNPDWAVPSLVLPRSSGDNDIRLSRLSPEIPWCNKEIYSSWLYILLALVLAVLVGPQWTEVYFMFLNISQNIGFALLHRVRALNRPCLVMSSGGSRISQTGDANVLFSQISQKLHHHKDNYAESAGVSAPPQIRHSWEQLYHGIYDFLLSSVQNNKTKGVFLKRHHRSLHILWSLLITKGKDVYRGIDAKRRNTRAVGCDRPSVNGLSPWFHPSIRCRASRIRLPETTWVLIMVCLSAPKSHCKFAIWSRRISKKIEFEWS